MPESMTCTTEQAIASNAGASSASRHRLAEWLCCRPGPHRPPAPISTSGAAWRSGADACLQLHHPDPAEAERLIRLCLDEVERLERVFSLYRPDSLWSA